MFRRLALIGGVPVLRDGRGAEEHAGRRWRRIGAEDARFRYFVGTERAGRSAALVPVLRVDRRSGESIPVFAAERSAIARFPDHAVEIFGDESEARASILCATGASWTLAASCLNPFLTEGRFDDARTGSGDHPPESVR